jgi:hypothetical protein
MSDMACADVATAKAKAVTATNLIIVFSIFPFEEKDAPNHYTRLGRLSAFASRACREGKDRHEQTASSARRGAYRCVMRPLV